MIIGTILSFVLLLVSACDKNTSSASVSVVGGGVRTRSQATISQFAITPVTGSSNEALEIVGGGSHVCVLLKNNQVKCWGGNQDGECDLKAATNANGAIYDVSNAQFSKISVSQSFTTCGILKGGSAEGVPICFGKKGDWLNVPHERVKDISAGPGYTCIIDADDKLYCVGAKLHILTKNSGALEIKAEELIQHGIDPVSKKEHQDFSHMKFKNVKTAVNRVCAQSADSGLVYCMGCNIHGTAELITEQVLDYDVDEPPMYFILNNGKLKLMNRDPWLPLGHNVNLLDITRLKYKKFVGRELFITAAGNTYDDGSSMPENTLVGLSGILEEEVLGAVTVNSSRKIDRFTVNCFLKKNHKIKCKPFSKNDDPNVPVITDIPPDLVY